MVMGDAEDTENIKTLRSYLNFKARVTITDGRVFIGTFVCIDKQKNMILAHTEEFRGGKNFSFLSRISVARNANACAKK